MLLFLKNNNKPTSRSLITRWHVNFRDVSLLPDIKAVRTSFFVNGLSIIVALGGLFVFVYQEYRINNLRPQIADSQKQIDHDQKDSNKAIALSHRFEEEERKINELAGFVKANKLVLSDFIIHIGQTLPKGIVLATFDYRASGVTLKGFVQGSSAQASGIASQYEKQLKQDKFFNSSFESISLPALPTRDSQTGKLAFEMALRFPSEIKGGKRP